MNRRRLLFVGSLLLCASIALGAELNHFKVYQARPAQTLQPITVTLKDQFATAPRNVRLVTIAYFANPVKKTHADTTYAIPVPNAHLTWYKFERPEMTGRRVVKFKNQFGEQKWELAEALFLLTPTQKVETGSVMPKEFNHFKAYRFTRGDFKPIRISLQDQFDRQPISVTVQRPAFFCNPVQKGNEPIVDARYHLACYFVEGGNPAGVRSIEILNQFKQNRLYPGRSVMVCVPTEKLGFEPLK